MRVYHYTSHEHSISNILNKRIKVSLFDDMNDPFELLSVDMRNRDERKVWNTFKEYFTKELGIVCFSSNWNNPVMWSHYADKHKGVCLGFDVSDEILKEVKYTDKRKRVQIGKSLSDHKITSMILKEATEYKFKDWKYESEYRGLVPLQDMESNGLYFVEYSQDIILREIFIGAKNNLKPADFKEYLNEYDSKVKVIKTRLAFKSFNVVRNKANTVYENM